MTSARDRTVTIISRTLVRSIAMTAGFVALASTAAIVASQSPAAMPALATAVAITAVSLIQLRKDEPSAVFVLGVTTTLSAIAVGFGSVDISTAHTALVFLLIITGVAGGLTIKRLRPIQPFTYAALAYSIEFFFSNLTGSPIDFAILRAGLLIIAGGLGGWMMRRVLIALGDSEARFDLLSSAAPITILREDFSRVAARLVELRSRGVRDIRSYMDGHPQELARVIEMIHITEANPAAAELMGVDEPEDLIGPLRIEDVTAGAIPAFLDQIAAVWNGTRSIAFEVDGVSRTGARVSLAVSWQVPISGRKLDFSRVILSMTDISQNKLAEERLEDLIRQKDQFIASVSHELRTPLTAVVGLTHALREDFDLYSEEEIRDTISMVAEQSDEVAALVEDLLVAARLENGDIHIQIEPVDLHGEIRSAILHPSLDDRVDVDLPDAPLKAMADPVRVRQILRNLLVNAVRYGGPSIRVLGAINEHSVRIQVRDNGAGVPSDDRDRIFEPYVSANHRSGVTASVGLGLTVSRHLAALMNGSLAYTHDGVESIFELRLPIVD